MSRNIFLLPIFLFSVSVLRGQDIKIEGPALEPHVEIALSALAKAAGAKHLLVREIERTAVDEAREMYKALVRYNSMGQDGRRIILGQLGEAAIPALDAFDEYKEQGKDLAIEYMAFHIEETVNTLRQLPPEDPRSRHFIYVLPLPYHLVELDIASFPSLSALEKALAESPHVLNELTLKGQEGKGRSCKNCYLIAIKPQ